MTSALLATNAFTITALTRSDSKSTFPSKVQVKRVDFDNHSSLVDALKGQDALIITLSARSEVVKLEDALVYAAAEADVPWILPNEWSPDTANEGLLRDMKVFEAKRMFMPLSEYPLVCDLVMYLL